MRNCFTYHDFKLPFLPRLFIARLNVQFTIVIYFHLLLYCSPRIQVSYEEFKLQFAQMYEHYEKHRTDNITDPELRQSRPISTISGWDHEREENGVQPQIQSSQQVQTTPTEELDEKEDEENESKLHENGVVEREHQKTIISSISDVYNKEISGESANVVKDSPVKENEASKLKEILEEDLSNPEQESKEIASEIVEEILQKSEKLLDECKQASDELLSQQETPVIKDEEIEQAVHEVVQGVRQIQLKSAEAEKAENEIIEDKPENESITPPPPPAIAVVEEDNKTDIQASAIIKDDSKQSVESDEKEITSNGERVDGDGDETIEMPDVVDDKTLIEAVINEIIDDSVNKVEAINEGNVEAVKESIPIQEKEEESKAESKVEEENSMEIEKEVKEVIDSIIDDAVNEVEQNLTDDKNANEAVRETPVSPTKQGVKDIVVDDNTAENVKDAAENDVANNNNMMETSETPEPDGVETKIHFAPSNDSALPSSLSDDSPINENKTNNSTPSPTGSNNDQHMDEHEHQTSDMNLQHDESHPDVQHKRQKSTSSRPMFSPGPTRPPFRIPEFKWSYIHQRLLSDVLFSLETDIQVWRSHSTKSVLDFVNSAENAIFVVNTVHLISQLADNLIIACGGLLPLLASATSPNSELDVLEPTQGMPLDVAVSFLQRLVNMADVLIFASSLNFGELEAEKNMSSGGILRQCLRLVSTCAVRNCLECKERTRGMYNGGSMREVPGGAHLQALIRGAQASPKNIVESLTGPMSPVKDPEKLLQDMDVNRLRAVIYRDVVSVN